MARRCCFSAAVLLVLLSSPQALWGRGEEVGAQSELHSIHSGLDAGEITPAQAVRRYRLFVRKHKGEPELKAEGSFKIGVISEALGRVEDAAGAYLNVLENTGSEYYMLAADALYRLGLELAGTSGRRLARARTIFEALTGVYTEPQKTAEIHYRKGLCSLGVGDLTGAEADFKNVIERFPSEPWKEKAFYRLGAVYYNRRRPVTRDKTDTEQAIGHFRDFLRRYPDSGLAGEAEEKLAGLNDKRAEYLFNVFNFYLSRGERGAAVVYYRLLAAEHPGSYWTELSGEMLD